jgi:hypothetical protein
MKKIWILLVVVLLAGCDFNRKTLRYKVFSTGSDSIMVPSQGYIHLEIESVGDWSVGIIDMKTDSLTVKDSIYTSNFVESEKEFIDITLKTHEHRIVMYDNMFGIYRKGGEKSVIFYDTHRKKWYQK